MVYFDASALAKRYVREKGVLEFVVFFLPTFRRQVDTRPWRLHRHSHGAPENVPFLEKTANAR